MQELLFAAFIGAGWAAWPIIAKQAGTTGGWVLLVVQLTSLLGLIPYLSQMQGGAPTLMQFAVLFAAGIVNCLALVLYITQTMNPAESTGLFIALVFAASVAFAPFLNAIVTKSLPTLPQILGLGLVLIGMFVVRM